MFIGCFKKKTVVFRIFHPNSCSQYQSVGYNGQWVNWESPCPSIFSTEPVEDAADPGGGRSWRGNLQGSEGPLGAFQKSSIMPSVTVFLSWQLLEDSFCIICHPHHAALHGNSSSPGITTPEASLSLDCWSFFSQVGPCWSHLWQEMCTQNSVFWNLGFLTIYPAPRVYRGWIFWNTHVSSATPVSPPDARAQLSLSSLWVPPKHPPSQLFRQESDLSLS